MDLINKDEVEKLEFPGSASNGNGGVRPPVHPHEQPREADSRGALCGTERGLGVEVAL